MLLIKTDLSVLAMSSLNVFCSWHNCEIVVLNNENTSPSKELVDDLISIIHVFSCRLYGLKRYKNKIKNDPNLK